MLADDAALELGVVARDTQFPSITGKQLLPAVSHTVTTRRPRTQQPSAATAVPQVGGNGGEREREKGEREREVERAKRQSQRSLLKKVVQGQTYSHTRTHSLTLTHTLTHTHSHTLTHTLTHSLTKHESDGLEHRGQHVPPTNKNKQK